MKNILIALGIVTAGTVYLIGYTLIASFIFSSKIGDTWYGALIGFSIMLIAIFAGRLLPKFDKKNED